MSTIATAWAWGLDIQASDKIIFLALADQSDDNGESLFMANETIAKRCHCTTRKVQSTLKKYNGKHLKLLSEAGEKYKTREWKLLIEGGERDSPLTNEIHPSGESGSPYKESCNNKDSYNKDSYNKDSSIDDFSAEVKRKAITMVEREGKFKREFINGVNQDLKSYCTTREMAVVESWNELALKLKLATIIKFSGKRKKNLKARMDEYGLEGWEKVLIKIEKSNFLTGVNSREWKATFDWVLQPDVFLKIYEGSYDDKRDSTEGRATKRRKAILSAVSDELEDSRTAAR